MDNRVLWTLPKDDFSKINVHGYYPDEPLPNGNRSGIGIVFRNDEGTIVRMFAGSLRIQERHLNEFYVMLYALRKAFFLNYKLLQLEFDHPGAYLEWRHSRIDGAIPEHLYVIRQLNTRRSDKNSLIELSLVNEECNALATYLAQHGANTWDCMVEIEAPFGRVKEIWYNDMGLGPIGPQYESVHEANLNEIIVNAELEMLEGDEMV